MAKEKRKSRSVWLRPRHEEMLAQMPGVSVGDLTRKAIEELFEGRNDREFARISVEDDVADMVAEWERTIGLISSPSITDTQDGFRIIITALKKFSDA
jgi:hypothetical protein